MNDQAARLVVERALGVPDMVQADNRQRIAARRLLEMAAAPELVPTLVGPAEGPYEEATSIEVIDQVVALLVAGALDGAIAGLAFDRDVALRSFGGSASSTRLAEACMMAIAAWVAPRRPES
jgi:hypothetical protein